MKDQIIVFTNAIDRELLKRATTYPKILARMEKSNEDPDVISLEFTKQMLQSSNLLNAQNWIKGKPKGRSREAYNELVREYKFREKLYPFFVFRHIITAENAKVELNVWRELIEYFAANFMPEGYNYKADLQRKSRRKVAGNEPEN